MEESIEDNKIEIEQRKSLLDKDGNEIKNIAILVENACKTYNGKEYILSNLNMQVKEGEIYALLGPSGCGKTTLLSSIVGLRTLDSGSISVFGYKPGTVEAGVPGPRVGFMPQCVALFEEFKINEALYFFGRICGMESDKIKARISFLLRLLDLPKKSRFIRTLSGGQKRRISFAAALLHEPEILILDEPTVGVDSLLRECIWKHMSNLSCSIIITTHYIEEACQANCIGIMRKGKILSQTSPENLFLIHGIRDLQKIVIKLSQEDDDGRSTLTKVSSKQIKMKKMSLENETEPNSNNKIYVKPKPWKEKTPSIKRLQALLIRNSLRIYRNIPFVLFFILIPLISTYLAGLCIGGEMKDIKFGYVNKEVGFKNCSNFLNNFAQENANHNGTSPTPNFIEEDLECDLKRLSCKFLGNFSSSSIDLIEFPNEPEALSATNNGKTWGYFVIPPKFTDNILNQIMGVDGDESENNEKIRLRMDLTSQPMSISVQHIFYEAVNNLASIIKEECSDSTYASLTDTIIDLADPIYGNYTKSFTDFFLPPFLILIILYMAVSLSSLVLILERKQGMYERSLVLGVTKIEFIISHCLVMYAIMLCQIFFSTLFAVLSYNSKIEGSLLAVFFIILMQGTIGLLMGFTFSMLSSEESSINQLVVAIMAPLVYLSGMLWPLEGMSSFLYYVALINPPTLACQTIRNIMNRGWGISHPQVAIGFLTSFSWILFFSILIILLSKFSKNS